MRRIKLVTLALALITVLSMAACDKNGNGDASKSENAAESSFDIGNNTTEAPLSEKSAEEVYEMVKNYFNPGNDLNYKVSYSNKSVSDGTETDYGSSEFVVIKNNGKDGMTLKAERVEGESVERYTYIDGFLYGYTKSDDGESKIKIGRTPSEMTEMVEYGELVHKIEHEFSELLSVECKIENNCYMLTIKGLAESAFIETVLNEKIRDESYIQLIKQFYTYDNENGYTATYVVDGKGRVVSYEITSEYSFSSDSPEYGIVGTYDYKKTERMESFADIPSVTAPEDADEYIQTDEF